MKLIQASLCVALSFCVLCPVNATGYPVFDVSNFMQAIEQVSALKKQYDQLVMQHQQLVAQHKAMTGSRGLGMIANDPRMRSVVPDNAAETLQSILSNGGAGMTPEARAIRAAMKLYDCEERKGNDRRTCQAFLNTNAQHQAYQRNAMTILNQRIAQIQSLQGQINATNDPKSVAELQARLQVEIAQVNNDNNRLAILKAMNESADRAAQQALKEQELKNLSLTSDGSDTFIYKPYSAKN